MAELLIDHREVTDNGDIIVIRVWRVPKTSDFPNGIKYSMVFVHYEGDEPKAVLRYDNEKGKSHHRHWFGKEEPIEFVSLEELVRKFWLDVEKVEEILYGRSSREEDGSGGRPQKG